MICTVFGPRLEEMVPTRPTEREQKLSPDRVIAECIGSYLMRQNSDELTARWRNEIVTTLELSAYTYFLLKVVGRENILPEPALYVPVPHCSHVDHVVIGAALKRRKHQFRIVADAKYFFETPELRYFYEKVLFALPLERGKEEYSLADFSSSIEALRNGIDVVIYPEGGREYYNQPMDLFDGVYLLALRYKFPIVPVIVEGTYRAYPAGARFPKPSPVTLRFLKPFTVDQYTRAGKRLKAEELKNAYLERVSAFWQPPAACEPSV
jgi:1-acyl-sn-glycerol-3-phosphate acyltransferase